MSRQEAIDALNALAAEVQTTTVHASVAIERYILLVQTKQRTEADIERERVHVLMDKLLDHIDGAYALARHHGMVP